MKINSMAKTYFWAKCKDYLFRCTNQPENERQKFDDPSRTKNAQIFLCDNLFSMKIPKNVRKDSFEIANGMDAFQ